MSVAFPFQAVVETSKDHPPVSRGPIGDINTCVEMCITRTAAALRAVRAASETEISHAITVVRQAQAEDKPVDLLETVVRLQGCEEEHLGPTILGLGDLISTTLCPVVSLIPFAGKLIAPSAFYESFEQIHRLGRALLAPVIFAEDTDAIGTASANPIAACVLAEEIHAVVGRRFGIFPFLTTARLDYESWSFLCRKHFGI